MKILLDSAWRPLPRPPSFMARADAMAGERLRG